MTPRSFRTAGAAALIAALGAGAAACREGPADAAQRITAPGADEPAEPPSGAQLFARLGCATCHSLDGTWTVGGTLKGVAGRERTLVDGRKVIADAAYLRESILAPNAKLVAGQSPVMPTYAGQLDDAALTRLVEFLQASK